MLHMNILGKMRSILHRLNDNVEGFRQKMKFYLM